VFYKLVGASGVCQGDSFADFEGQTRRQRQFASANQDRLVPVFSNADFVLYRISSYPPTQQAALKPNG
jgi:hypothetical protein